METKEFEKDLKKAKKFAESLVGKVIKNRNYLGKGYHVECLPEYYKQIVWFLTTRLNYVCCNINENTTYNVEDNYRKRIDISRIDKEIKLKQLR